MNMRVKIPAWVAVFVVLLLPPTVPVMPYPITHRKKLH